MPLDQLTEFLRQEKNAGASPGNHWAEEGENMLRIQRLRDKGEYFLSSGATYVHVTPQHAKEQGKTQETSTVLQKPSRALPDGSSKRETSLPSCCTVSTYPEDQAGCFSQEKCCLKHDAALCFRGTRSLDFSQKKYFKDHFEMSGFD